MMRNFKDLRAEITLVGVKHHSSKIHMEIPKYLGHLVLDTELKLF